MRGNSVRSPRNVMKESNGAPDDRVVALAARGEAHRDKRRERRGFEESAVARLDALENQWLEIGAESNGVEKLNIAPAELAGPKYRSGQLADLLYGSVSRRGFAEKITQNDWAPLDTLGEQGVVVELGAQ